MRGEVNVNPFNAACSEFPNDNPALHEGTAWVVLSAVGRPRAVKRPPPSELSAQPVRAAESLATEAVPPTQRAAEPRAERARAGAALAFDSGSAEQLTPEPDGPDAFSRLVALLSKVALASGATRAAAVLPDFVSGRVIERSALGESLCVGLIESGHAIHNGAGIEMSDQVGSMARAWCGVLSGQSEDLSACEETLDCWSADLVAALAGAPVRAAEFRKELRRFGVAAFGLLADAA
jgi:hypothetical protein